MYSFKKMIFVNLSFILYEYTTFTCRPKYGENVIEVVFGIPRTSNYVKKISEWTLIQTSYYSFVFE